MMALLIGGIVIMSLMSIAVPERRREIGVRRSVGAARGDSVQQFLLEAVLVALAGGLAGVLMGWGGMQIVTRYPDRGRCPLNFFLRWFGCSALVVSGLGMLSITWITVKERTREFGTRRALGATASGVFLHVLSECSALALAGCTLGASASWPLSRAVSQAAGLGFVFSREAAASAFAAALVLNVGFAFWPSRKAALVSPCEALRYEFCSGIEALVWGVSCSSNREAIPSGRPIRCHKS